MNEFLKDPKIKDYVDWFKSTYEALENTPPEDPIFHRLVKDISLAQTWRFVSFNFGFDRNDQIFSDSVFVLPNPESLSDANQKDLKEIIELFGVKTIELKVPFSPDKKRTVFLYMDVRSLEDKQKKEMRQMLSEFTRSPYNTFILGSPFCFAT